MMSVVILCGHCWITGNGTWATQSGLDSTTWTSSITLQGFLKRQFNGLKEFSDKVPEPPDFVHSSLFLTENAQHTYRLL